MDSQQPAPPRRPLRIRASNRLGQGYIVVLPTDAIYEACYQMALFEYNRRGTPMPYADAGEDNGEVTE